ncbi:MAG: hypothetical protein ACK4UU_03490 [Fimbriimonadales bacterium]
MRVTITALEDIESLLEQYPVQTLRPAGLDARAVLIGLEGAHPETRTLAQHASVARRVGKDYAEGLKAL